MSANKKSLLTFAIYLASVTTICIISSLSGVSGGSTSGSSEFSESEDTTNQTNPIQNRGRTPRPQPTWIINLNDNTFLKHNGNGKPSYYFPPGDPDGDILLDSSRSNNKGSMVTFYFLLGLFLLFSSMFFCWYFAHHESIEALRRHNARASRRLSRLRGGNRESARTAFPEAHHISVIMPNEDGYHCDPPPLYNDIFASEFEKKNSPYILPSYGEIMSGNSGAGEQIPSSVSTTQHEHDSKNT